MKLDEILSKELYEQVQAAIEAHNAAESDKTKHVRYADLGEGGYVSVDKYNDKIASLTEQLNGLNAQLTQRDTDIAGLNKKLTEAQGDAAKYMEMQASLSELQTKYANDRTEWEQKLQKEAYGHLIRERAGQIKFTSPAAKRDFIAQATAQSFEQDGENLKGYDDFLKHYTDDNPGAIAEEPKPGKDPTVIVPPKTTTPPPGKDEFVFKFNGVRPHD